MMIDEVVVEIVCRFALRPTVSFLSVEFLLKIEMSSFSKLDVFSHSLGKDTVRQTFGYVPANP